MNKIHNTADWQQLISYPYPLTKIQHRTTAKPNEYSSFRLLSQHYFTTFTCLKIKIDNPIKLHSLYIYHTTPKSANNNQT